VKTAIQNGDGTQTVVALEDGNLVTGMVQQCAPIADITKYLHNTGQHGSSDMRLAASIPLVFVEKYLHDNRITMHEFTQSQDHKKRLLGDPALAAFRVWNGRI